MILSLKLSALIMYSVMSVKGKKVLHIDRNDHYGGSVLKFIQKIDFFNIG